MTFSFAWGETNMFAQYDILKVVSRASLVKLVSDATGFKTVQDEAKDVASINHLQSKLKLALCEALGIGVTKNVIQGFEKICDVEFETKQCARNAGGILTVTTLWKADDSATVFDYFNKQEPKSPRVLTILGICYLHDIGVPNKNDTEGNNKKAFKLLSKAAKLGDVAAKANLRYCYQRGIGVPDSATSNVNSAANPILGPAILTQAQNSATTAPSLNSLVQTTAWTDPALQMDLSANTTNGNSETDQPMRIKMEQ